MNAITPAEQKFCLATEQIHCTIEESMRTITDDQALIQFATIKGQFKELFDSVVELRREGKQ